MKIAVEGMDGCGKTTIAKELAKRNGYRYIGNAIHQVFDVDNIGGDFRRLFQEREDQIFLQSGNDILRAWLCCLGNIYTATQVKDENFIVDRHILSNFLQNGTKENAEIYRTLYWLIGAPDMSIILYASPEERLKRIASRNPDDQDLKNERIIVDSYDRMIGMAKKYNMPHIVVNTDGRSIEDIIEEIESKVFHKNQEVNLDEK